MPSTVLCTGKATYKKQNGTLQLTNSHITWTPDGKVAPSLKIPNMDHSSLLCSKVGAAQVKLKLVLYSFSEGHTFTFTNPAPVATAEREQFKNEITNYISRNRTARASGQLPTDAPATPATTNNFAAPPPRTPTIRPPGGTPRASSIASDKSGSGNDVADYQLRKRVLLNSPELATLHRELVMTGQITESEFWDGREHLLSAQAAMENQKKGKSGQLVDPRPQTVDGEIKIVITPQLVHDIFEEYPVVGKAYSENVPSKLTSEEFWKRYFESKLFHANRASIRSSATQHVVKADPIFDQYLVKDDDGLEPRKPVAGDVEMFVDLGATAEDHGETGNQGDTTMQAGRQKAALPLIRRFNEHSERLLKSALGDGPSAKRRRLNDSNSMDVSQIELDDLKDSQASEGIALDMKNSQRYFESRATSEGDTPVQVSVPQAFNELESCLGGWERSLTHFTIDKKAMEAGLASMTSNVKSRLEVKTKRKEIPENLMRQMSTCQTAANEFLRHYWHSIYPPPSQASLPLTETLKNQRAAKAAKMAGYLASTREKVEAIVKAAPYEKVDPRRVELAMRPVLDAVNKALAFQRNRIARGGTPNPQTPR
ncbi:hypothetical protein BDM02DRAFT_3086761 [Thelephora ganbajun]|uniref:Uncharacterized protein n=1 Tax=Thelephora ganbajun TaxID=370292 RepID=A0ACB6ZVI8_THEGA|nr:hypothetical protein BDM02DRAFT_3086761 [Thelephora ganbajun]